MWILLAVGAALVLAFSWAGGEVYESVVEHDALASLDQPVLNWAVAARTPALDSAVTAFTNVGGGVIAPIVAAAATALLTLWMRHWRPLVLIPAAALGSLLATVFGKEIAGRARPPLTLAVPPYEHTPSFPSGHTLNATVIAGIVAYLVCLKLRQTWARVAVIAAAALYAVSIGLSRVFLGHHWLTDVVAAWFLGLAWLTIVIVAHRVFHLVRLARLAHAAAAAHDDAAGPPSSSSSRGDAAAG
jgi:undecaprenyl-diphosphatase